MRRQWRRRGRVLVLPVAAPRAVVGDGLLAALGALAVRAVALPALLPGAVDAGVRPAEAVRALFTGKSFTRCCNIRALDAIKARIILTPIGVPAFAILWHKTRATLVAVFMLLRLTENIVIA